MTACRFAEQDRRRAELVRIRQTRKLTEAELREEERLENALYHRSYRQLQREESARLNAKIAAQAEPPSFLKKVA